MKKISTTFTLGQPFAARPFAPANHEHPQYLTAEDLISSGGSQILDLSEYAGFDTRYYTQAELDVFLDNKAAAVHYHTKSHILDFNDADYATALQGALAESALQAHPPIAAAASTGNTGRTYIQNLIFDAEGHVIGVSTATETLTNTDTTYTSADFVHDNLSGVDPDQHLDWSVAQVKNIHPDNYTDTTYVSSDFNHDSLSGVNANQHIDWTVAQGTPIHPSNYSQVTDHSLLSNVGTNTHVQIDTHLANTAIHFQMADISITEAQVSNLRDYVLTSSKGALNGVASLDAEGKIPAAQLPAVAVSSIFTVTSSIEQTDLDAQEGDFAIRTDLSSTWIHNGGTTGTIADWTELPSAPSSVVSVDGRQGNVLLNDLYAPLVHTHTKSDITDLLNTDLTITGKITGTTMETDSLQFTGGAGTEGTLTWNADEETLDLQQNGAVLQLGQELHIHARNNTGVAIANGKPVMATGTLGASGRVTIALMDATDPTSHSYHDFLGLTTEAIPNGEDGKVSNFGKVRGIDTSGTPYGEVWNDGDEIWLDPDVVGGLTNVEPIGTKVGMPIGRVVNAHASAGTIFVYFSNIDENHFLHTTGKISQTVEGDLTFEDNLTVVGNLVVSGTTTTVNSNEVNIADSVILLNSDIGALPPTEDAGIEIARGTSNNVSLLWDEFTDYWKLTRDGTVFHDLITSEGGQTINGGLTVTGTFTNAGIDTLFEGKQAKENGFDNRTDSQMSFDDLTRTFTIEPVGASFTFYTGSTKYTKTTPQTLVIPDSEGLHFFYFDLTGTLQQTQTFSPLIITDYAFCALVYWDATNKTAITLAEERHGNTMDSATHLYNHETIGTRYGDGLQLADISADGTGNAAVAAQCSIGIGSIWDEDIHMSIPAKAAPASIPFLYKDGANGDWRKIAGNGYVVTTTGTGRAAYNEWTGTVWQLTEVGNTKYMLMHLYASNDINEGHFWIIGENEYNSVADARIGARTELITLETGSLPTVEYKSIATVIIQSSSAYSNAVKSRIRTTDDGFDFIEWRFVDVGAVVNVAGATVTQASEVVFTPGSQYEVTDTNVQLALDRAVTTKGGQTINGALSVLDTLELGDNSGASTGSVKLWAQTAANKAGTIYVSNGNLHIDTETGHSTYLNYYKGTAVYFGSGAGGNSAVFINSSAGFYPITDGAGSIGLPAYHWGLGYFDDLKVTVSEYDVIHSGGGQTINGLTEIFNGDPGHVYAYNARTALVVGNSNAAGATISVIGKSTGYSGIFFGDESAEFSGQIKFAHTTNALSFYTGSGDRFEISNTGAKTWTGSALADVIHAGGGQTIDGRLTLNENLKFALRVSTDAHIDLYNGLASTGYAIGVESGTLYHRSATNHRWYINTLADGGVSQKMNLSSTSLELVGASIDLGDGYRTRYGAADDLQIWHDGSNSFIDNATGFLIYDSSASGHLWRVGDSDTIKLLSTHLIPTTASTIGLGSASFPFASANVDTVTVNTLLSIEGELRGVVLGAGANLGTYATNDGPSNGLYRWAGVSLAGTMPDNLSAAVTTQYGQVWQIPDGAQSVQFGVFGEVSNGIAIRRKTGGTSWHPWTHVITDVGGQTINGTLNVSTDTNHNLRIATLAHDSFTGEGVGIKFTRTTSDAELMALGVVDQDKLMIASRTGMYFMVGGGSFYSQATTPALFIDSSGTATFDGNIIAANYSTTEYVGSGSADADLFVHGEMAYNYSSGTGFVNTPSWLDYGIVETRLGSSGGYQLAVDFNHGSTNSGQLGYRTKNTSGWGTWTELVTTAGGQTISGSLTVAGATTFGTNSDGGATPTRFRNAVYSDNDANVDGPNFDVRTATKSNAEYAYKVTRNAATVGGFLTTGVLKCWSGSALVNALHTGGGQTINGSLGITGSLTGATNLLYMSQTITDNVFINDRRIYIDRLDDGLFAATLRYNVTSSLSGTGLSRLFDGNYDSIKEVPVSSSDIINIDFGGPYPGYSYGYIEVHFYYVNIPDSVTCRVYTNYAPHGGPGWINVTLAPIATTGSSAVWRGFCGIYQITDMEITVNSGSSVSSQISGIKFLLQRKQPVNEKPYFTKYQQNYSYYDMDFLGATVSIDGNEVIHSGGGQAVANVLDIGDSTTLTLSNPTITNKLRIGTTVLTETVGLYLANQDGTQNNRVALYLDATNKEYGFQYTYSTNGVLDFVIKKAGTNTALFQVNDSANTVKVYDGSGLSNVIHSGGNQIIAGTTTFNASDAKAIYLTGTGSRIQLGPDSTGFSGTIGARQSTDGTTLKYSTYWAYDCYWDNTNRQWNATRTTLTHKWKTEMSYHGQEYTIDYFNGDASVPWTEADWSTKFRIGSTGPIQTWNGTGLSDVLHTGGGQGVVGVWGDSAYQSALDLNTVQGDERYNIATGCTNVPSSFGATYNGTVWNYSVTNSNNSVQFAAKTSDSSNPILSFRAQGGNVWGSWRDIIHTGGGQIISSADSSQLTLESTTNAGGQLQLRNTGASYRIGVTGATTGNFLIYDESTSRTVFQYEKSTDRVKVKVNGGTGLENILHSGDIGTGAGQVAAGNHTHSIYSSTTQLDGYQSFSDFTSGTLIRTSIIASNTTGISFVLKIEGKSYSGVVPPFDVILQGYIYNNTFIATSAIDKTGAFGSYIKILEDQSGGEHDGTLAFWFPRMGYWQSFKVSVWNASTFNTSPQNLVTAISNATEPESTKKVQVDLFKSVTSLNDVISGDLTIDGALHLPFRPLYLYTSANALHSIQSTDGNGSNSDDIRINTFGSLFINLDSNLNNSSEANFQIGRHGGTGTISEWLFTLNGETGNVGIGTAAPQHTLHVLGSSATGIVADRTNGYSGFGLASNGSIKWSLDNDGSTNSFAINENGSIERLTIAAGGAVSVSGDLSLSADNLKLRLGAADDLQLYHDGSFSQVVSTTTSLSLNGNSGLWLGVGGAFKISLATTSFAPHLGAGLTLGSTNEGWDGIYLKERASNQLNSTGKGQIWVKDDTPNVLMFTDDVGTSYQLNGGPTTYSTGTYTATITPQTSGSITLNSTQDTLAYTKIGRQVHVTGSLSVSAVSSPTGHVYLLLPFQADFTSAETADIQGSRATMLYNLNGWAGYDYMTYISAGSSSALLVEVKNTNTAVTTMAPYFKAGTQILVDITYNASS